MSRWRRESEPIPTRPVACNPRCLTKCSVQAVQKARIACGASYSFRHATHLSAFRKDSGQAQECNSRCAAAGPDGLARHDAEDRRLGLLDPVSGRLVGGQDAGVAKGSGHRSPLRELAVEMAEVFHGAASQLSEGLSGPVRNRPRSSYTTESLASGSVPSLKIAR